MLQNKKDELNTFAADIRMQCIEAIACVGSGHVGGCLSIAEVLACLYGEIMRYDVQNPRWEGRDRFIMSKGHAGPALYSALALKGFFPLEMLNTLNKGGTNLPSHCDRNRTPGIDMTTGSLGQGVSAAVGIAYACRLKGRDNYTYLLIGDGECDEGQVWEGIMFAAAKKLDHLIAFVDKNGYQVCGSTDEIIPLGDITEKFKLFGWHAIEVTDGHDVEEICRAVEDAKQQSGKPVAIILNTIKGKGWTYAEQMGAPNHNFAVTEEDAAKFALEIQKAKKSI